MSTNDLAELLPSTGTKTTAKKAPAKKTAPAKSTAAKKTAPAKATAEKTTAAKKTAPPKATPAASPSTAKFSEGTKVEIVKSGWSVRGWMVGKTGVVTKPGRARIAVKLDTKADRDKLGSKLAADGSYGIRPECLKIVK